MDAPTKTISTPQTSVARLAALPKGMYAELDRSDNHHTMGIALVNQTSIARMVDVTGTVLRTRNPLYQRVLVVGVPGTSRIRVPAMRRVHVVMATCCLDKDLRVPDLRVDYEVTDEQAPAAVLEECRRWVDEETGMTLVPRDEIERMAEARLRRVQGACWAGK